MPITKKYTNDELTVKWEPEKCIHSEKCFHGLKEVFNPANRPWVNMAASDTTTIAAQVDKCPSGALSYYYNDESKNTTMEPSHERIIEVAQDGPLLIYDNFTLKSGDNTEHKEGKVTALCRCGASENKPYCDGTHKKIGFKG